MTPAHGAVVFAAVLSALCVGRLAAAQPEDPKSTPTDEGETAGPNPQDRALAEALFQDGKKLGTEGRFTEACRKFKASQRLDPQVGTLLYLAACYQHEGKTASAWAAFTDAAGLADRKHETDRAKLARERAAALEGQLAKVTISVAKPLEGMVVELDGRELAEGTFSTPLPMDPGSHLLKVTAPGKKAFTQKFEVETGASEQSLEVPALEDLPPEPVKPAPAPAPPPVHTPPPSPGPRRTIGFVAIGVGAVGVGVGSYFGLHAASQAADADKHCQGSVCTQQGLDGYDNARGSAMISNVAFGVGLAGIAVGTYFVLSSRSNSSHGDEASLQLRIAPGQASLGGSF